MKTYATAVIGCGYWGPNLVRNFMTISNDSVKMVCDRDPQRLEYMRKLYPSIGLTSDEQSVIDNKEIEAVVIATPVVTHYILARKALEAGKHVFIEKPMASSVKECQELIKIARKKKTTLMVGHTFLYTPVVKKIKEIIDKRELGEILYISSRRLNLGLFQKDINVAWDLAPHDISIILYIMNEKPVSVNCQGMAHLTEGVEDVTNISLQFEGKKFATIHSSWLDPNKVREMTFVGSKRMLVYNDIEPNEKIKIYDKRVEVPPHYNTFAEFHYSYHYGDVYSPYINQTEPLRVECQHFWECIETGKEPDSSGQNGLEVVQILEASSESLRNGGSRIVLNENTI
jgi:predicted dehydrogenase